MATLKTSVSKEIKSALIKWRESKGGSTPGIPYTLVNAEINYEKGELVGAAQISSKHAGVSTNGISIFVVPPPPENAIYCGGTVGPPEGGSISLTVPISLMASSTKITLKQATKMTLLVIIVYNGTTTCTLAQDFTVGP